MPARFDDFAQLALWKGVSSLKINIGNFDLGRFGDLEGDRNTAAAFVRMRDRFDFGLWVAALLVELLELHGVHEELVLVQGLANFRGELFGELAIAVLFVPDKVDFGNFEFGPEIEINVNAVHSRFVSDANIGKKTGGVEVQDIVVDGALDVRLAFLGLDIGADERFADGLGADVGDDDFVNGRSRQRRHLGAGSES